MTRSRARIAICALSVVLSLGSVITQTRFVDDAKREVQLPPRVSRVFAAGAPAEVLLYTLVPDMLAGRNRLPEGDAVEFFPPQTGTRSSSSNCRKSTIRLTTPSCSR